MERNFRIKFSGVRFEGNSVLTSDRGGRCATDHLHRGPTRVVRLFGEKTITMDSGALELTGYSKCNLERCTYRFLQHLAKSLSLPSNVKKVYLVALIYAKKNLSETHVEDIKHQVAVERELANSTKRTSQRKKKERLQAEEVSSSNTCRHSPPIALTPRSSGLVSRSVAHDDPRGTLKVYSHGLRGDPPPAVASGRVLRSYCGKSYKRPNYAFLNNADHIPATIPRGARYPTVNISAQYMLQDLRQSLLRAAVVPSAGVVSITHSPSNHQGQRAVCHKATQHSNSNFKCVQSIGFRQPDGRISKINAIVQKPAPNISVHDIERSNCRNDKLTLQDLLNCNIHSQIFTNPMQNHYQRQKSVKRKIALDFDSESKVKKMAADTKNLATNTDESGDGNIVRSRQYISQSNSSAANRPSSQLSTDMNENFNMLKSTSTNRNDYPQTIDLTETTHNNSSDNSSTLGSNLSNQSMSILSGDIPSDLSNSLADKKSALKRAHTMSNVTTTTTDNYLDMIYDSFFNTPNMTTSAITKTSQQPKTATNVKNMSETVSSANNYPDMPSLAADVGENDHLNRSKLTETVTKVNQKMLTKTTGSVNYPNMSGQTETVTNVNHKISNLTAGSHKDHSKLSGLTETVTSFNHKMSILTAGSENYPNVSGLTKTVTSVNQKMSTMTKNSGNNYPNMSTVKTGTNQKMANLTASSVYPNMSSLAETVTNVNHKMSNPTADSRNYLTKSGLTETVTTLAHKMPNCTACSVNNYPMSNLTEIVTNFNQNMSDITVRRENNYANMSNLPKTVITDYNTVSLSKNDIITTNLSSIAVATNECSYMPMATVSIVNKCSKLKLTEPVSHKHQSVSSCNGNGVNHYPNMSRLTETLTNYYQTVPPFTDILSNNYEMILGEKANELSAESSVYYYKNIRAENVRSRRQPVMVQEQLPKFNEVFTKFGDYSKDPTQPLFVQVGSETQKVPNNALFFQHTSDTSMLEMIYNVKRQFLTNPPFVAPMESPATTLVYCTPVMCSTMVQPSTALSDPQHVSSCELQSLDDSSQACDVSPSRCYSQESPLESQDITLPMMIEDALEVLSQDGDYMERISMEVRVQCILCSWAGPQFILELHIRKEHSSEILDQESRNSWNITHRLGALVAQPQWRSVVAQRRDRLYALSVKYEDPDSFMATLTTITSDPAPKLGTITIYHRVTGEPYSWQGRVQQLPVDMPYENDSYCLKLQLSRLELIPNSARLKLHNREFVLSSSPSNAVLDSELVAQSPTKTVFGRPELNDIQITVFVTIDD